MKKLFDLIGYSNLFLALNVFASTIQGGFIFNEQIESCTFFAAINFFAAFILYNIQRMFQSFQITNDERLLWFRNNLKTIFITFGVLFFILICILLNIHTEILQLLPVYGKSIYIYCLLGFISILYFLPPFELRKIPFLKNFYIAFVWVIVCILTPFLFNGNKNSGDFTTEVWMYIFSQFFFISAICIPFDIRDIDKDRKGNVQSIPVLIGIRRSKMFAGILLFAYLLFSVLIKIEGIYIGAIIMSIISTLILTFSEPTRHRYYYIYLTDGLVLLQSFLFYILLG